MMRAYSERTNGKSRISEARRIYSPIEKEDISALYENQHSTAKLWGLGAVGFLLFLELGIGYLAMRSSSNYQTSTAISITDGNLAKIINSR